LSVEVNVPIFDMHQHVGKLDTGGDEAQTDSSGDDRTQRAALLDQFGLSAAGVMPSLQYERPRGLLDTQAVNEAIAAYRDAAPQRFPLAFGTAEPLHGIKLAREEVSRLATELKLDGVVWHHRFQGAFVDDRRMHALLDECEAQGLPALVHMFAESDMQSPHALETLAREHPGVSFVALDALSGYEQGNALLYAATRCPNLYLETAGCVPLSRALGRIVTELGSERVLFGTDCYLEPRMWNEPIALRELTLDPRITDADRENIFWHNAVRLFPQLADRVQTGTI
jgi:predicted TIM-barrel fold metal-dependent hydrolase